MPAYLAVPAPSAILPAPFRCAGDRGSDSFFFASDGNSLPRRSIAASGNKHPFVSVQLADSNQPAVVSLLPEGEPPVLAPHRACTH